MQLTENFNLSEFACKDGTPVPGNLFANVAELAKNLQIIRDEIGAPLHINSAYRTKAHNAKVGGKPNSQHLYATAADITTKKMSPRQLHSIILNLINAGKISEGGVGLYPGFVHYDIRGTKARW